MTDLVLRNLHPQGGVDLRLLREITLAAVEEIAAQPPAATSHELAILLVNDRRMAALNESHLQHPGPTDVITFDYAEAQQATAAPLRGDIFIGLDVARRQAREFHTDWTEELVRYVVHGLLHLRGYDDLAPAPRRLMKRAENRVLRRLATRFAFRRLRRRPKLQP